MITNIILWIFYASILVGCVYTIIELWNAFTSFKTSNILPEDAYMNAHFSSLITFFFICIFVKFSTKINVEIAFNVLFYIVVLMFAIGIICTIIGILNKTIPYKFRWLNGDETSMSIIIGLSNVFIYGICLI